MKDSKKLAIATAICSTIGFIIGVAYYPIYATAWVAHKVARLVLAISYFLMFRWRIGYDILRHFFKTHE